MQKFPSIEQFRNVVQRVTRKATYWGIDADGLPAYNPLAAKPTLEFRGYVKLHGTNAAIVFDERGVTFQSRERELTAEADNSGFYAYMSQQTEALAQLKHMIGGRGVVYGEWCGQGIQKGVAISSVPKMFVIFAVKIDDEWKDLSLIEDDLSPSRIWTIDEFITYYMTIDFNEPSLSQNQLVELTMAVEEQCPVGAAFGIDGVGEGIVWQCITPGYESSDYWFKVKGEKHSASKVKTLAEVDVQAIFATNEFVEATVTEQRLEQGLQNLINEQLKPFEMTSIGDFIRWVYSDIMKEESDVVEASGLDAKKLGGPIANKAKKWYIGKLQEEVMDA